MKGWREEIAMATSRGTTQFDGLKLYFAVVDPLSNYWRRKEKRTKQKRGEQLVEKEEEKERKKKTEKEMKTKPLDRIVFRANVQYLDGWILSRSCRCFIFKHSQKLAGLFSKIYRREPPPPGAEQTREGRTKVQPRWSFLIKSDLGSLVFELENWFQRWERENCSRQPDDSS